MINILVLLNGFVDEEHLLLLGSRPFQEVIKNVKVALALCNRYQSTFLQQVTHNEGALYVGLALAIEQQNKFAKARGIVVSDCFSIPKGFQDLVTSENLVLDSI